MSDAATALVKLIDSADLGLDEPNGPLGLIAMQPCAELLSSLSGFDLTIWCPFYPWAKELSKNFSQPLAEELPLTEQQEQIIVLPSKQKEETLYLIACAIKSLKAGGSLYIAAPNDAGGNRLKKMLGQFGLSEIETHSKNKCKILRAHIQNIDSEVVDAAIHGGRIQSILEERFFSQIGLYGWNKEDIGSQLLCESLPTDLHGLGADFGCGYGFLSRYILDTNPKVRMLCTVDAELRAIGLTKKNLVVHDAKLRPTWDDLTDPDHLPKNLDFVVMNPPFHSGKGSDSSIGTKFITSAHQALKRYGRLYMVANTHLPYEKTLDELFHKSEVIAKKNGFKVICAGK